MFRHLSLPLAVALLVVAPAICESQQPSAAGARSFPGANSRTLIVASVGVRNTAIHDSMLVGPPDSFMGPDKVKHFFMSAFIEAVGFSALQAAGGDRSASLGAATTVTLGIGVAREIHDGRTKGLFSLGDLTWDAVGTAATLLLLSHTQR